MTLGKHALADLYDCENDCLNDVKTIKNIMLESCKESNLTVVGFKFHKFKPYGVSGICVLKESHVAIHTWPEYNFVSVDAFTCGEKMDPSRVCKEISKRLKAQKEDINEYKRGIING